MGRSGRPRCLEPGQWLAVLGAAGGSGIAAVQLGRAIGAHVIAVVSDEARAEFCRGMGADETINIEMATWRAGCGG